MTLPEGHPIIFLANYILIKLIIMHERLAHLHAGVQTFFAFLLAGLRAKALRECIWLREYLKTLIVLIINKTVTAAE